jgi:hypothetical protein
MTTERNWKVNHTMIMDYQIVVYCHIIFIINDDDRLMPEWSHRDVEDLCRFQLVCGYVMLEVFS